MDCPLFFTFKIKGCDYSWKKLMRKFVDKEVIDNESFVA